MDESHDLNDCNDCLSYLKHRQSFVEAREEYGKEIDPSFTAFTADMQKVILIPKLTTKEHIFVSRLVVFNETFACLNPNNVGGNVLILWHEAMSGRKADVVTSAYVKFIRAIDCPKVLIWADNCGGQNKNWRLFSGLVQTVNQSWGPNIVRLKYLERGHTFMAADSVHGAIGRKMKKKASIVNFRDFVEICASSQADVNPVIMENSDFRSFQKHVKSRDSEKVKMPLLHDIVEVEFRKGSSSMFYKEHFNQDDYIEVDFFMPKYKHTFNSFPGCKRDKEFQQKRGMILYVY